MSLRPLKRAKLDVVSISKDLSSKSAGEVEGLEQYRISDMPGAEVFYVPRFIESSMAEEWYSQLVGYQPKLKVYGRETVQSRKSAAYATSKNVTLKYSGQIVDMCYEYPPFLRKIQDEVECKLGVIFNHVMLNLYEDGSVYIGKHRDKIGTGVIASVSLGAPRTFVMAHSPLKTATMRNAVGVSKMTATTSSIQALRSAKSSTTKACQNPASPNISSKRFQLESGSVLIMQGETQYNWTHEIPKEHKVTEGRISLTFRQLETSS